MPQINVMEMAHPIDQLAAATATTATVDTATSACGGRAQLQQLQQLQQPIVSEQVIAPASLQSENGTLSVTEAVLSPLQREVRDWVLKKQQEPLVAQGVPPVMSLAHFTPDRGGAPRGSQVYLSLIERVHACNKLGWSLDEWRLIRTTLDRIDEVGIIAPALMPGGLSLKRTPTMCGLSGSASLLEWLYRCEAIQAMVDAVGHVEEGTLPLVLDKYQRYGSPAFGKPYGIRTPDGELWSPERPLRLIPFNLRRLRVACVLRHRQCSGIVFSWNPQGPKDALYQAICTMASCSLFPRLADFWRQPILEVAVCERVKQLLNQERISLRNNDADTTIAVKDLCQSWVSMQHAGADIKSLIELDGSCGDIGSLDIGDWWQTSNYFDCAVFREIILRDVDLLVLPDAIRNIVGELCQDEALEGASGQDEAGIEAVARKRCALWDDVRAAIPSLFVLVQCYTRPAVGESAYDARVDPYVRDNDVGIGSANTVKAVTSNNVEEVWNNIINADMCVSPLWLLPHSFLTFLDNLDAIGTLHDVVKDSPAAKAKSSANTPVASSGEALAPDMSDSIEAHKTHAAVSVEGHTSFPSDVEVMMYKQRLSDWADKRRALTGVNDGAGSVCDGGLVRTMSGVPHPLWKRVGGHGYFDWNGIEMKAKKEPCRPLESNVRQWNQFRHMAPPRARISSGSIADPLLPDGGNCRLSAEMGYYGSTGLGTTLPPVSTSDRHIRIAPLGMDVIKFIVQKHFDAMQRIRVADLEVLQATVLNVAEPGGKCDVHAFLKKHRSGCPFSYNDDSAVFTDEWYMRHIPARVLAECRRLVTCHVRRALFRIPQWIRKSFALDAWARRFYRVRRTSLKAVKALNLRDIQELLSIVPLADARRVLAKEAREDGELGDTPWRYFDADTLSSYQAMIMDPERQQEYLVRGDYDQAAKLYAIRRLDGRQPTSVGTMFSSLVDVSYSRTLRDRDAKETALIDDCIMDALKKVIGAADCFSNRENASSGIMEGVLLGELNAGSASTVVRVCKLVVAMSDADPHGVWRTWESYAPVWGRPLRPSVEPKAPEEECKIDQTSKRDARRSSLSSSGTGESGAEPGATLEVDDPKEVSSLMRVGKDAYACRDAAENRMKHVGARDDPATFFHRHPVFVSRFMCAGEDDLSYMFGQDDDGVPLGARDVAVFGAPDPGGDGSSWCAGGRAFTFGVPSVGWTSASMQAGVTAYHPVVAHGEVGMLTLRARQRAGVSCHVAKAPLRAKRVLKAPMKDRRQMSGRASDHASNLLRVNVFKRETKCMIRERSAIHDWGLFAIERIPPQHLVTEYIGELIRPRVAEFREKRYEEEGMFSTYLFVLNENWVVDATCSGNVARYINHSCETNCMAKPAKREDKNPAICILSTREIQAGEEITYNYKLPIEQDPEKRVPCRCGSEKCAKFLN